MPLDANRLGDAMKVAIDGVSNKADRTAIFRALATAIVAEITTNADVVVESVSGVVAGSASSGAGTGSIV